jgi:hypothetical protein
MHPESSAKIYRVLFQPKCYAQALGAHPASPQTTLLTEIPKLGGIVLVLDPRLFQ